MPKLIRENVARWVLKHHKLITKKVSERQMLDVLIHAFAPEIEHVDMFSQYKRNGGDFLRDGIRGTYWRGERNGAPVIQDGVRVLSDYYGSCFVNLCQNAYDTEMDIRREADIRDEQVLSCGKCGVHYLDSHFDPYRPLDGFKNDERWCIRCWRRKYQVCSECNGIRHVRDMINNWYFQGEMGGKSVCKKCGKNYIKCQKCGIYMNKDKGIPEGNMVICEHCYRTIYRKCKKCGEIFSTLNRMDGWEGELSYCDKHLFKHIPYHSYKFRPSEYLFQKAKNEKVTANTLYLGLELEFELDTDEWRRTSFAKAFKGMFGHKKHYIVHDGSLNYGLEIVPMPFTERWYHEQRKWLKDIYEYIVDSGHTFHGRKVGFHVHTSTAAWEKSQIYKLVRFIYKGGLSESSEFESIYGRRSNKFCLYTDEEYDHALYVAKGKDNYDNGHHYNALNFSTGKTIEFRMFAGPRDYEEMLMRIDFVLSCYQFTSEYGFKDMNVSAYIKFLNNNPSQYFRILNHLRKGGCSCV